MAHVRRALYAACASARTTHRSCHFDGAQRIGLEAFLPRVFSVRRRCVPSGSTPADDPLVDLQLKRRSPLTESSRRRRSDRNRVRVSSAHVYELQPRALRHHSSFRGTRVKIPLTFRLSRFLTVLSDFGFIRSRDSCPLTGAGHLLKRIVSTSDT